MSELKPQKSRLVIEYDPANGKFTEETTGPLPGALLVSHLELIKLRILTQQLAFMAQQEAQAAQQRIVAANGISLGRG